MKLSKKGQVILKRSLVYWLVVIILYAAILTPLIPAMKGWPTWLIIVIAVIFGAIAIAGQVVIIISENKKAKD